MDGSEFWIRGHIHEPLDYMIGKTRFVFTPFGYIDEQNDGLTPTLTLKI